MDFSHSGSRPSEGCSMWHRWFKMVGKVFWYWFGHLLAYKSIPTVWARFVFVMVSHMITMPLHVQFTLSHFAMSITDVGQTGPFPQKMLRTTMDIFNSRIHHLFPGAPRHNLRRTQKLVPQFCLRYGFVGGNLKVVGSLAKVSRQAI